MAQGGYTLNDFHLCDPVLDVRNMLFSDYNFDWVE